jgi:hypothetical protein
LSLHLCGIGDPIFWVACQLQFMAAEASRQLGEPPRWFLDARSARWGGYISPPLIGRAMRSHPSSGFPVPSELSLFLFSLKLVGCLSAFAKTPYFAKFFTVESRFTYSLLFIFAVVLLWPSAAFASLLFFGFEFSYVIRLDRCQVSQRLVTICPAGAHLTALAQSHARVHQAVMSRWGHNRRTGRALI